MQCRASNPLARRIERRSPKTCVCRPARKTRGTEVMEMKGGKGENNQQENKEAVGLFSGKTGLVGFGV